MILSYASLLLIYPMSMRPLICIYVYKLIRVSIHCTEITTKYLRDTSGTCKSVKIDKDQDSF